nr:MAG TPA: tail tape measure [Caudoviricetes sp.]
MAGYVDEKVAKVTLDNKGFTKNASDTISALEKMKQAFAKISGGNASKNIAKEMNAIPDAISKSTTKSQGLLSRLKGMFTRSTEGINMNGAAKSIEQMNTDVASRTTKTSSILARLKGIFQKADNHQGFPNSVKSIDSLNSKASGINLNPLTGAFSRAADSVKGSLNAMDVAMGIVMGNMLQKAISFGSKFFAGPVDGLNEYKEKLGSVQTIMTNTEWEIPDQTTRMRKTSKVLEDLNEYADQTIYSFKDMTKNIGTFTAAGVGLEDSATAIKGISNLAAASGSNTQQASMAMYQLSQALASGRVGLQDWNSVVNAGMGGKLFQDRLTEMAEKMGNARDMTKSFRESLKSGWLTSEVLINTLKEFSVDESMLNAATQIKSFGQLVDTVQEAIGSGWATSWEYLFGGFEEAKALWTDVGKVVGQFFDDSQGKYHDTVLDMDRSLGNYRNAMLKTWKDLGGQTAFFDSIKNGFEFVFTSMTNFRNGFRESIGTYEDSAKRLLKVTEGFKNFTENLKKNAAIQETLISLGRMFGAVFNTVWAILHKLSLGFRFTIGSMDGVILVFKRAADGITKFLNTMRQNHNIMQSFTNIGKVIANVLNILGTLFKIAADIVSRFFSLFSFGTNSGGGLLKFTDMLVRITDGIRNFVEGLRTSIQKFGVFKGIMTAFGGLFQGMVPKIVDGFKSIAKAFPKTFSDNGIFAKIGSSIKNGIKAISPGMRSFVDSLDTGMSNILSGVKNNFGKVKDVVGKAFGNIGDGLKNSLSSVKSGLSNIVGQIGGTIKSVFSGIANIAKQGYDLLKDIFKSFHGADIIQALIGLFAFDKWLKFKSGDNSLVTKFLDRFEGMFDKFLDKGKESVPLVKKVLSDFKGALNDFSKGIKVGLLVGISVACLMLAVSLDKLSKIDMKDLSKAMIAMGAAMAGMMKIVKTLGAIDGIPKGAGFTLIGIAIAIRILAGALKKLEGMDMDSMVTAVAGIRFVMNGLVKSMKRLSEVEKTSKAGITKMIAFAFAMRIIVGALAKLKGMGVAEIGVAMVGVRALMRTMTDSMKELDKVSYNKGGATAMIGFAIALRIIVSSVAAIAKLDPEGAVIGMVGAGALMEELSRCMKKMNGVVVGGRTMASMIGFAISLRIIVMSVKAIAKLQPEAALQGLVATGYLMEALVLCMKQLNGTVVGGRTLASMIGFAISLRILVMSVKAIAKLQPEAALQGLLGTAALMEALVLCMKQLNGTIVGGRTLASMIGFAISVRILVLSVKKLASLPIDKMIPAVASVGGLMEVMTHAMKRMGNVKFENKMIMSMIAFAGSVYILALSVEKLTKFQWDQLLLSIGTISILLSEMLIVMNALQDVKTDSKSILSMIAFAGSVFILGKSVEGLSTLSLDGVLLALGTITTIMAELIGVAHLLKSIKIDYKSMFALMTFTLAIYSIGKNVEKLSKIPWKNLAAATGGIGVVIVSLGFAAKQVSGMGGSIQQTLAIAAIFEQFSRLLRNIGDSLVKVAKVPWQSLTVATVAIGVVLAGFVYISKVMSKVDASAGDIAAIIALSNAVNTIGNALSKVANHPWQNILSATAAMGAAMGGLVIMSKSLEKVSVGDAGKLLILSVALTALAVPIALLASLNLIAVGISLGALAGHLILLIGAAKLAQGTARGMAILSKTLMSFGASSIMAASSIAIAGIGFLAFSMAIKNLADTAPKAFSNIVQGLLVFVESLVQAGPRLMKAGIELIVQFVEGIAQGIPRIIAATVQMILALLDGLASNAHRLVDSGVKVIVEFAKGIMDNMAILVQTAVEMATKFIEEFGKALISVKDRLIPALTQLFSIISEIALKVIKELVGPIIQGLLEIMEPIIEVILQVVERIAQALAPILVPLIDAIKTLIQEVSNVVQAIADTVISIVENLGSIIRSIADVIISVVDLIKTAIEGFVTVVQTIGQTIQVIFLSISSIVNSVMQGIVGAINAFADVIRSVGEALKNVFVGIGQGIQAAFQGVASVVESFGAAIKSTFEGIGTAAQGIGQGIQSALQGVASIVESVGSAVKSALEGIGKAFEGAGKFAEGFGKGIESVMNGAAKIVDSVGNAIKGIIEAVGHAFRDIGKGIELMGEGMKPIADHGFKAAAAITAVSGAVALLGGASYTGNLNGFREDLDKLDTVMYKMSTRTGSGGAIKDIASALNMASSAAPSAASALEKFAASSEKIKSAASGMDSSIKNVANAISSIGQSTMGAIPGITVLAAGLEKVANTLSQFIARIASVSASMSSIGMIFTSTGSAITNLGNSFSSISNGTTSFGNAMNQARTALAQFGASAAGSTTSFAVLGMAMTMAMTLVVNAVNNGMNQARAALQQGFAIMGMAAATSMTTVVMAVNLGMMSVVNAIRTNMASVSNVVSMSMVQVSAAMSNGIAQLAATTMAGFSRVNSAVNMAMSQLASTIQAAMGIVNANISSAMSNLGITMSSAMSRVNASMSASMNTMSSGIMAAMSRATMIVSSSMSRMVAVFMMAASSMNAAAISMGHQISNALAAGMSQAVARVSQGMAHVVNIVRAAGGGGYGAGYYTGSQISAGVAAGMWAHVGSVEQAAARIITAAQKAANAKAIIKSPSRLFANKTGKFIPQGIAMGIAKEMPRTVKQMGKTFADGFSDATSLAVDSGNGMASAVADAVNTVGTLLDDSLADMDYRPTITPVVDTTNLDKLQNGNILRGIGVDATNVPRPAYSGVPSSLQSTNTNVYDNSNKEYSITVKVDNGGKPVDGKQLAREIQQHIKDFDDQTRRGKGEEVLW